MNELQYNYSLKYTHNRNLRKFIEFFHIMPLLQINLIFNLEKLPVL